MLLKVSRTLTTLGALALAGSASTASAQFWCCNPCVCCPPPVRVQPAYCTVPVTEMQEVRQVVQKPIVETKYVDQPHTEYRQIVETKTAEIPTVSYQPVTEYQTVQRDCGRWTTQYHYRPKMHPCQYDGRPDLLGFLNRTQYSVRMAFTPDYYAERNYQPNVMAYQVPVTRQVAVRGSQTVNYQVARVVPITTTRRVAVNSVRMVAEEVVTRRPVTVMKTVPFGSAYAFGTPTYAPQTTTALQPVPDPRASNIAIRPRTDPGTPPRAVPERTADAVDKLKDQSENIREEGTDEEDSIHRKSSQRRSESVESNDEAEIASTHTTARPIGKWVARRKPAVQADGPIFPEMAIAQANAKKKR
jgi:hypothetical protein